MRGHLGASSYEVTTLLQSRAAAGDARASGRRSLAKHLFGPRGRGVRPLRRGVAHSHPSGYSQPGRSVWQLQPLGKEEVMNITIVGAMGLVGSQLVSLAKSRGHEVIALDLHR